MSPIDDLTIGFLSKSPDATRELAHVLSKAIPWGSFIGLYGDLGAGKTEFVRGFVNSLQAVDEVVSPTYVLEHVYEIPYSLDEIPRYVHHWDFYRLNDDYQDGDLLDYQSDKTRLVVIEWPEKVSWVEDLLNIKIHFSHLVSAKGQFDQNNDCLSMRKISFSGISQELHDILKEVSIEGISLE